MSGNKGMGGGGYRGGGTSNQCEDINFETTLFSPVPAVLALIKKRDLLSIEYTPPKGPLMAMYNRKLAGTIITKQAAQLIVCIQSGVEFIAVVKTISGGSCTVQIKVNNA